MLARFDLSTFSRRRSAKFVLAFLLTVVVISLVTFSAKAWWIKPGSAAKQDAASQQTPGGPVETELIKITSLGLEPS